MYFAWFFRAGHLRFKPHLDIPMPLSRLRSLMQFRMGSHSLPVEQGRLARPMVPPQLRQCTLCDTHAISDERHFVFDCRHFAHLRRQFRSLIQDADGAMQSFMWHQNQKAVCHCLAAIWQMTQAWTCPHPMLPLTVSASCIFLMIVMGPCVYSCGTHVRRTLLAAP